MFTVFGSPSELVVPVFRCYGLLNMYAVTIAGWGGVERSQSARITTKMTMVPQKPFHHRASAATPSSPSPSGYQYSNVMPGLQEEVSETFDQILNPGHLSQARDIES